MESKNLIIISASLLGVYWILDQYKKKSCSVPTQNPAVIEPPPPSFMFSPAVSYECDVFAYADTVMEYAIELDVDPSVALAIMWQESKGKSVQTWEAKVKEYSWGPMQILGSTAREMGWTGPLDQLKTIPKLSVYYGMKYIATQYSHWVGYASRVKDTIASYNAGWVYTDNNGIYKSKSGSDSVQKYVDLVMSVRPRFARLLVEKYTDVNFWI